MDYYSLLGVDRNATPQEIKKAYRKLAMKHHPDKGGDSQKFAEIQSAYEVLSNSDKRQAYDNPGPQFDFNSQNFDDFFNFGFRQQRHRGRNITLGVNIDLEDVIHGKQMIITYQLPSGKENSVNINIPAGIDEGATIHFPGLGDDSVPGYRGDLFIRIQINQHPVFMRDHHNLHMKHYVDVFTLLTGGKTNVKTLDGRTLDVNIKKGLKNGSILNLNGQGLPSGRGRGNLYVNIQAHIPNITNAEILEQLKDISDKIK